MTGPTFADWIRWAGLAAGVLGILATGSPGVALFVREIRVRSKGPVTWARGHLRFLHPRRPNYQNIGPLDVIGISDVAHGGINYGWDPSEPTDAKVERVHQQLQGLRTDFDNFTRRVSEKHDEFMSEIGDVRREIASGLYELRQDLDAEQHQSAKVDARGLPLVAFGLVMTTVPVGLASMPLLAWFVIAGTAILAAWTLRWLVPEITRLSRPAEA